jgi:hypothetical protein
VDVKDELYDSQEEEEEEEVGREGGREGGRKAEGKEKGEKEGGCSEQAGRMFAGVLFSLLIASSSCH